MKKSLLAAAAIATLSLSADAMASGAVVVPVGRGLLDLQGRIIDSPGLGPLGIVDQVTALGRVARGRTCTYLMEWESPYNPNAVGLCALQEVRTPLNTSCLDNAYFGSGVPTAVLAGDFAGIGLECEGFDLLGVPSCVSIMATARGSCVEGVVIFDGYLTLSLVI